MSYYLQETKYVGTVSQPIRETNYWKFTNKNERDSAVANIVGAYVDFKNKIPEGIEIRDFSHFEDIGRRGTYIKMIAK
jgi:hypothetical protein